MTPVEIMYEHEGYQYRAVCQWKRGYMGRPYWAVDHWYKTPYFRVDWLRGPFGLDLLSEREFQFWIALGAPEPHHLKVEEFTSQYFRRLIDVHEQLGIPLGEWEDLRLGLKMLSQ